MALTPSSVTRHIDPSGDEIKALLDDDGTYVQAIALVDEDGDQISTQHTIGNGNGLDVNIRTMNGQASDSFGRLKISQMFPIFETTSRYDIDNSIWTTSVTGTGAIAHSVPNASIQLTTTDTTINNASRLTSLKNFRYQPGKSQLIMQTLSLVNPDDANCDKRWGYFDDGNGIFWGVINGVFGVGIRNNGVDTFVPQTSFNRDKLDGTGDLLLDTDLTKSQIYYISFQFLGVGIVEMGIYCRDGRIIPAHVFQNANTFTYSYMQTALLPIRCEVENTGVPSAACGINVLCATVNSEGGNEPLYTVVNSVSNNEFTATNSADEIPILTIRAKSDIGGVRNKVEAVPLTLSLGCEDKAAIVRVRENSTLTNAGYNSVGNQSSIEYVDKVADATLAFTGLPDGNIVDTFVMNKDQSTVIDLTNQFAANKQSLNYNNADFKESLTITIQRAGGQAATNTSVLSSITWAEIR